MTEKSTRIVLLAKRTEGGDALREILLDVFPKEIPVDFLYMVNLVYEDDKIFEVPLKVFKKTLKLGSVQKIIEIAEFKKEVDCVEIVLDLAKVKKFMTKTSDSLFANVFLDS